VTVTSRTTQRGDGHPTSISTACQHTPSQLSTTAEATTAPLHLTPPPRAAQGLLYGGAFELPLPLPPLRGPQIESMIAPHASARATTAVQKGHREQALEP